jgi:hypothetical protein
MVEEIYRSPKHLDFIVKIIKAPMVVLLNQVADRLPEPTKENMHGCPPNTQVLIELRDEFFHLENNPGRHKAFKAIWNFVIFLYGYDGYYRHRIDWVIERLKSKTWQPRDKYKPAHFWREWDNLSKEERLKMRQFTGKS